ncbi:hemagglutinin repeat-containing protein [Dyella acidisoli]|uniref:Member of ShlA/HecA/FhaA exoprotein family n=1 Tax=Dyella acidisoli TaxID=1867834 RepID=A0ABQ5XJV7_9GAMM|nr:hemagglutinin repeat-containing protein [Dyella acidisoli]GLQ91262.1 member of ShlA/HecA/FhaA exoprotein family [Dyella acidisoli]
MRRQALWAALTLALGLPNAHAQTVPDGATHTNVIAAPNGVPVVNIAAPNNAGVSHNTYQQFNVSSNGLILNNSGAISNTQLAGYITGNPNLGPGQSATLILNEVTSTQPSVLNGAMEVAGHAAQVVVANPNGITCGGCGFINAPRGTLVTGVPILDANGGLSGFNVSGGTITVNAQGLLGSQMDQVDLLARAVEINAGVWAHQINVITGSNRIDYTTLATQSIAGTGATPAVALDVSALGGMYANAIRLIGTEAGLGVNSQGQISAQNGDLSLTSAGQVTLGGKTTATGNLTVQAAQSLSNQGTLAAGGAVNVSSADLSNSGTLYSGSAMTLSANGQLSNSGQIEAQNGALTAQASGALNNAASASIYAGSAINLSGASFGNAGTIEAAQGANLQTGGHADNSGILQTDAGDLVIHADSLGNSGTLSANGNATLGATSALSSTGKAIASGNVSLSSAQLTTSGAVQAGGALSLQGGTLSNSGKLYALGGAWTATLSGAFANQSGSDVYGSQNLALNAASLTNAGNIEAQQGNAIKLVGALINSGKLQSDQSDLTLSAFSLSNSGTLSAYGNLQAQVNSAVQNSGVLVSGQAINLSSAAFDNQVGGQIQSGTDFTLSTATLNNEGSVNAKGNATLSGTAFTNASGAQWITAGILALNQTGNVSNAGVVQSGGDLNMLYAASLTNSGAMQTSAGNLTLATGTLGNTGTLGANGSATLNASNSLSSTGTLLAGSNVSLTAAQLTTAGTVQAGSALTLSGGTLSNSGKLYALGGAWTSTLTGAFTSQTSGDIYGSQGITLSAASLSNAGSIEAQQADTLTLGGAFTNSGKLQSDQSDITLNATTLSNSGTLSASHNLQAQLTSTAQNSGVLVTGQAINLTATGFDNQAGGQVQSGADLTLSAATQSNEGIINAKGNAALFGTALTNAGSAQWIAGGTLTFGQTGGVSNAGVLQAGSDLDLTHAASLNNTAGATMYAGQDFNLGLIQALTNAGMLYATRTATFTAGSVNNTGTLRSAGTLTLDSNGNVVSSGAIQAQQTLSLQSSGDFSNSGELYAIGGNLSAQVGGSFSSASSGDIYSGQDVSFSANSFANTGTLEAKQSVSITAHSSASNSGTLQADNGNLVIAGSALTNQGTLSATGATQLGSTGTLSNSGKLVTGQTLVLTGASVTNSGQIQSGSNVTVQAASVTNSGSLQAGGTLAFQHDATLTNQTGGSILAASDLSADTSSLLDNAGIIQGGGNLNITGTGVVDNEATGTLYGTQLTTLQLGGALTNAGTVYGAQGFNLTAASLVSTGSLRSGTSLSVATQGNASNGGTAYALGNATWNIGGTLSNTGTLAAAGNATLTAASLSGNGTLAASLQSNGSLGNTGDLTVTTTGNLADNGRALAAGNLRFTGSTIDLSSSQTRANTIALTANQGNVTNAGGNLAANSTVTITTPGSLINGGTTAAQGGKISAGTLVLQAAALNNQYGSLIQTGSGDLNLTFGGAFENANGTFSTNAQNLSINAASVDNTGGTLQDAGSGTLSVVTSGNFANGNGKVEGNGALSLQTNSTLTNDGGLLSVSGNVTTKAGTFSNVHGTLIGNNVGLTVAQTLTNTAGGTIQSGGALTANANALDNSGGFIKVTDAQALNLTINGALTNGASGFIGGNGAATINAGSLTNAGQIYAGTALGVTAQSSLINDGGALQALGSLSLGSNGALSNRAGTIEAGSGNSVASMSLNGASLDDTNGRIANTGQGTTTVSVAQNVVNEGGTLGGQGAFTLSASSLDNNNSGKIVAGQALTLSLGSMSNVGGTLYAAGDLTWNDGSASLENAQGSLQSGGNLTFALASLDNASGTLATNGSGNLSLGSFTGVGKVAAGQNLTLTLSGNYTNAVGNQLSANNNLTLNVSGNFSNAAGATLQAPNNLTVSAANIDNAAGATLNSNSTTLSTGGTLSNEGNIDGSSITLNAGALTNTANIIGGSITATAGSLTNGVDLGTSTSNNPYQSGLIAATNSIALYVSGALLNRDATIFTTGDLTLAGNASGGLSASITNLSGDIEANGSVTLNAQQFTNQRRVFQTTTYNLTAAEQAQNSTSVTLSRYAYYDTDPTHQVPNVQPDQVISSSEYAVAKSFCDNLNNNTNNQRCAGYPFGVGQPNTFQGIFNSTVTAVQEIAAISSQSKLLAGGNITINGSVLNDKSTIAAGNNLTINGQNGNAGGGATSTYTVQNIAFAPTATVQTSINEESATQQLQSNPRAWVDGPWMSYGTSSTSSTISLAPGSVPSWITFNAGSDAPGVMSAGNTVSITAQTINNTTVGANGQPVQNAIGLGSNSAGQAVGGNAATTVGSASGASGSVGSVAVGNTPNQTNGSSLSVASARSTGTGSTVNAPGVAQGLAPGAASTPGVNSTSTPATGAHPSLASPQVVSTLVGPNATIKLPQTGLYAIDVQPGSEFLIETNPQFTRYSTFISSDYMLQKLGLDPHQTEQRLGDGFYEQQQVLDQITDLTGRRYLADDTDALDQYRDLMNNAVQVAQQFNLSVGVALTPAQMANLTQDIVWLVNVNVDGHQVLEPVVYLSTSDAKNLAANGATIAGKNVVLNASGDITNNGTIAASQNAQLTASNLLNSGTISAGNDLSLTAAQNILNGGTIKAGGNVSLVAGGDVLSGVSVAQNLGAVALPGLSTAIGPVALNNTALPGGITAGGSLAINAGRDLQLDTAPVKAGGNLSLAAGRDLTATATAISAGGNAQLLAGRDLSLIATGSTNRVGTLMNGVETTTHTVSTLSAGGALTLVAGNDLISQGAQLTGGTINLGAGHDATLTTVTDSVTRNTQGFQGHMLVGTGQSDQTVRGTTLTGSNGINVAANHDLTITAGQLNSANGDVALSAGNNLTLNAANEDHSSYRDTLTRTSGFLSSSSTHTYDASSDSNVIGTSISGNNVTLAAGNNLATQAVQLTANNALSISAVNNVTLGAGEQTHTEEHDYQHSSFNFFSDSTKRFGSVDPEWRSNQSSTTINQTTSIGSTLSGDTVTVAAGHDLTGTAVQIAGTHDVTLAAGNNLTLNAGQDTYTETQSSGTSHTGLMNGGGFSVLIGNKSEKTTSIDKEVSYTGSLVGSTDGAVTLTAGNNVHITGSDVLSQTATTIVGKNVTIDAALGSQDITQTQKQSQGGISLGLSGGVAGTAQTLAADVQGATSSSSDSRLKALYAMQAAQTLFSPGAGNAMHVNGTGLDALENTPGALQSGYQKGLTDSSTATGGGVGGGVEDAGKSTGISLHIGIGGGSSTTTGKTHDDVAYGSKISSNGDVTIAATGGDLNVVGSQINGNNVTLSATHDINLLSQAEQHTQSNDSHNASGEVGISIGQTTGIYLSAAAGEAIAHGNGTTHTDSVVSAQNTLTMLSGNDTTIKGAQATGNTVLANIGGNLNVASEQDTNDYASHSIQGGITLVYGWSDGGVGVSGNLSASKANSNYASVTQMSGIGAGNGGFDLLVGGNTNLKGAVVASTASVDKNILDTGSLTYSNIQNQAKSSAESISVGGGMSTGSMSGMSGFSGGIGIPQNSNKSSTTQAGIAQGTVVVRDNPKQDLSGLNRNPSLSDANGLANTFDPNKVAQNQQAGMLAGQVGMTAVGDIAYIMQKQAAENLAQASKSGDQAAITSAQTNLQAWSDGGADKVLLHGLVGAATAALGSGNALQGALGASAGEIASGAMQNYLLSNHIDPSSSEGKALMQLGSAIIGGSVGGGAGAATAIQGDQYNRQLHPAELSLIVGDLAKKYVDAYNAAHPDATIDQTDAETMLIKQALRQVDNQWAQQLGQDDGEARAWLAANASQYALPNGEQVFTATDAEKANWNLYADPYKTSYLLSHFTTLKYGLGDQTGASFDLDQYASIADQIRDNATLAALYRKVDQGQTLTESELNQVAYLQALKPLLQLNPVGSIGVSLADGKYMDAAGQSILLFGPAALEGGLLDVGRAASSTYDAALGQIAGNGEQVFPNVVKGIYQPTGPLLGQLESNSCVAGCVRMAATSDMPEAYVRAAIGTSNTDGTSLASIPGGLQQLGYQGSSSFVTGATADSIAAETAAGSTAIVNVKTGAGSIHAVVVDEISGGMAFIRDPWPPGVGSSYSVPVSALDKSMTGQAVFIKTP